MSEWHLIKQKSILSIINAFYSKSDQGKLTEQVKRELLIALRWLGQ